MLTQNSTTVSRNKYQLVKNLNVAYMYNTIANSSAYACRLQLAAGQLLVLTVGRWFQAAAAASQCSFDDCPRIHSLDGLRFSEAIEALDGPRDGGRSGKHPRFPWLRSSRSRRRLRSSLLPNEVYWFIIRNHNISKFPLILLPSW